MESVLASLLAPYQEYSTLNIFLEATAVFFGLLSVWFSKKNNIWVYPTGILSTLIFVYLLYKWGLLGDMLIYAYYFSIADSVLGFPTAESGIAVIYQISTPRISYCRTRKILEKSLPKH